MAFFAKKQQTVASIVAPLQGIVDNLNSYLANLEDDTIASLKQIDELHRHVADNSEEESKALRVANKIKALLEG